MEYVDGILSDVRVLSEAAEVTMTEFGAAPGTSSYIAFCYTFDPERNTSEVEECL